MFEARANNITFFMLKYVITYNLSANHKFGNFLIRNLAVDMEVIFDRSDFHLNFFPFVHVRQVVAVQLLDKLAHLQLDPVVHAGHGLHSFGNTTRVNFVLK